MFIPSAMVFEETRDAMLSDSHTERLYIRIATELEQAGEMEFPALPDDATPFAIGVLVGLRAAEIMAGQSPSGR